MFSLEAKIRTECTCSTRESGLIPAVVYGKDVPSTKIAVGTSDFIKLYRQLNKGDTIELTVDGKKYSTRIQELQRHPVSGAALHIDFLVIA